MSLANLRREYTQTGLDESELEANPVQQFQKWFHEAASCGILEPNAMVLATVDAGGQPSTRLVLLKAVDERGFSFFTNYESRKGRELAANPKASATFPWLELERQVCLTGTVTRLPEADAQAYWRVRPRGSRLGAWASHQSEVIPSREELEQRLQELERRYPGDEIPLPPYWGGYLLAPQVVEFWQGRLNRLHDRLRYVRIKDAADGWKIERLSP